MNKILSMGIREEYPAFVKEKLRVSNVVLLVVCSMGLLYSLAIAIKMPELRLIAFMSIGGVMLAIGAGLIGLHRTFRVLLCIIPVFIVWYYHIGVVPEGQTALASSMVMMLAYSIFPFIVFDVREKFPLFLSVVLVYALIISFRWTNAWVETTADIDAYRTGYIQEISITVSFFILCATVYSLNLFGYRSEIKRLKLIDEGDKRAAELEQKGIELKEQMRKIELNQQEEKLRNWAAEGYSFFGGVLRKNDDLQQLYDELLAQLVRYIDANQGALYVAEEEGKQVQLVMRACYAYGRKKFKEKVLEPGQGLVGQCYLEQDHIYMTEVPQGYTYITSGLGDATPAAILIVPLIANDKVEGVLEFAAFKPFPQHVIQFVQKLGEEIAATLSVGRINSLTRMLLAQAQEQAEAMRAQEEEMRQNMEELSATQEEMQRKEQEYIQRIKELEGSEQGQQA